MLFSILIPTYNNEKTIARAIESALNQDYCGKYEIVIVNNASTDATLSIIESYNDPKIKVITNKSIVHMYENHNICIEHALGSYVIFCHSDDVLMPDALKILAKKIEDRMYPQRYVVWGYSMIRDFSMYGDCKINQMFSGEIAKRIFIQSGLTPSGTCFSRKAMLQMGCFPIIVGTYDIDWVFEVLAAFGGWEFEMIDRLLYKREYASTYTDDVSQDIRQEQIKIAVSYIYTHLNPKQRHEVECMWAEGNANYFDHIFATPLPSKQEKLDALLQRFNQSPWKVWKILKWVLIKMNIWK